MKLRNINKKYPTLPRINFKIRSNNRIKANQITILYNIINVNYTKKN